MTARDVGERRSPFFDSFVERLSRGDWSDDEGARSASVDALTELRDSPGAVASEIAAWSAAGLEDVAERSHETSTHYKWFVFRDPDRRFTIWLHQYKPATRRGTGHAATAHNHRYGFSSLVLVGGFTQIEYAPPVDAEPCAEKRRMDLRAGDVFSVEPAEIHRMDGILDPTMTLIIERRPVHHHSVVYDLSSGTTTEYPDFVGQYETLVEDARLIAPV
jgi:hypothetical protein